MTVAVQTTFTASIANGVTTVFPYAFKIAAAADLAVTVDGVLQTSGYTVSGVGDAAGGNVTFSVAPANGAKVIRYLAPVLNRPTDYQQFGDWLSTVVNLDFDRLWLAIQTFQQNDVRAIKLPIDTSIDQTLTQDAAARAFMVVGFDADGNVTLFAPVDNTLMAAALAASGGSGLLGHLPAGTGAVPTTVQSKLRKFATDNDSGESSLPCFATVSVNHARTVLDKHAFEDWSALNITAGASLGYSSFDSKPTLTNSVDCLHLVSYQARSRYAGSANLTQYWHGYDTAMVHNGSGTITEASGVNIGDITGTGKANITNFYGVYIATLTAGASRYAIYSDAGNSHMLGGTTGTVFTGTIQAAGLNYNNDNVSKTIAIGFGSAGQTNFGIIDFYNGKNAVVVSIQSSGLVVTGAINASGVTKSGSYTVATLPAASEGFTAYCTNGRKVGEGAGAGTGVPVYYSSGAWRVFSTDAVVSA